MFHINFSSSHYRKHTKKSFFFSVHELSKIIFYFKKIILNTQNNLKIQKKSILNIKN